MRKSLSFVAFVVGSAAQSAFAADFPVKAPPLVAAAVYDWSGFYVGGHLGGLFGQKDWREIVGPVPGGSISPDYSGVIGGGQIGYNYQTGNWVFGIEGEFALTNAEGSTTCIVGFSSCGVELNWVATVAARIGYAWNNVLVFAKGGAAWIDEDYPVAPGTPFAITLSQTRSGWLVGAGFEYGFTPNWSAKLEYNYLAMGTDRLNFGGAIEDITQDVHIVKAGLNYRFRWY